MCVGSYCHSVQLGNISFRIKVCLFLVSYYKFVARGTAKLKKIVEMCSLIVMVGREIYMSRWTADLYTI